MPSRDSSFSADCAAFLTVSLALGITLLVLMGGENPPILLAAVAGSVLLIFGLEVLAAGAVSRIFGVPARRFFLAAMAGINGYSLYIVHLNQSLLFEMAYAFGFACVVGLMLAATDGKTVPRLFGVLVVSGLPALSLWGTLAASGSDGKAPPQIAAYSDITFNDTPNIYLFSFDALMPSAAAQKVLEIDDLVYEDWLRDHGALLPKNSFVTFAPSIPSLDAVMKLDDNTNFREEGYFAGRLPSPLSEVLRANGYSIETGSSIPYYFGAPGDFVDKHTFIAKNVIRDNSLCKFAAGRARRFGVFGLCMLEPYFETGAILDESSIIENPDAPYFDSHWHDLVLKRIATPSERARFMFYYYFYPVGHAPNDFVSFDPDQTAAYRKRFLIQSEKARDVIAELVEVIEARDPGAIVIVFGDHGPKTSRTADWKKHTEFWVLDNHAVLVALLPTQSICARPALNVYNKSYHTVGRVLASVLRCLASDPTQVDAATQFLDKFPFEKYLYE